MVEAFHERQDLLLIAFRELDSVRISEPQVHLPFLLINIRVYKNGERVLYRKVGYNNV